MEEKEVKETVRTITQEIASLVQSLGSEYFTRAEKNQMVQNALEDYFLGQSVMIEDDLIHNASQVRYSKAEDYLRNVYLFFETIYSFEHSSIEISDIYKSNGKYYIFSSYRRSLEGKDKRGNHVRNQAKRTLEFVLRKSGELKLEITYLRFGDFTASPDYRKAAIATKEPTKGNSPNKPSKSPSKNPCTEVGKPSLNEYRSETYCLKSKVRIDLNRLLSGGGNGSWRGPALQSNRYLVIPHLKEPGDYNYTYTEPQNGHCESQTLQYTFVLRKCKSADKNGNPSTPSDVRGSARSVAIAQAPHADSEQFIAGSIGGFSNVNLQQCDTFTPTIYPGAAGSLSLGIRNWQIGADVDLGFNVLDTDVDLVMQADTSNVKLSRTFASLGLFIRYDFMQNRKVTPFVQAGLYSIRDSTSYQMQLSSSKKRISDQQYFSYQMAAGVEIKLGNSGAIELRCGMIKSLGSASYIDHMELIKQDLGYQASTNTGTMWKRLMISPQLRFIFTHPLNQNTFQEALDLSLERLQQ